MHASIGVTEVPADFRAELDEAAAGGWRGRIALLGHECQGAPWEVEGLRLVGRQQIAANSLEAAAVTFDEVRARVPLDNEASLVLASIRPRLDDGHQVDTRRTLLFTGHRIDAPGRKEPRFPAEKEPQARAAIRAVVAAEAAAHRGPTGLAGAASGGDILFQEVCDELGVPTRLFLALPPERYIARSVAEAGAPWVRRFWTIYDRHPTPPLLSQTEQLPDWLRHREPYSIWQRNNLWMLNEALAGGARAVTVVALWNGKAGDGPGGTADMIAIARARGADVRVVDTAAL